MSGRARLTRRSLSLRARLLDGLIALTAIFLVVMGVVTTVVLGTLERNQLNDDLQARRQAVGRPGSPRAPTASPPPTSRSQRRLRRADAGLAHRRELARRARRASPASPRSRCYDRARGAGAARAAVRPRDPAARRRVRVVWRLGVPPATSRPSTSCRRVRPSSSSAARRATSQATSAAWSSPS